MAQDFHSPLPHVDFKAVNRFDPDDFGRKCRVQQIGVGKHVLCLKSKAGYVTVGQAPFPTTDAAIAWANQVYSLYGELNVRL